MQFDLSSVKLPGIHAARPEIAGIYSIAHEQIYGKPPAPSPFPTPEQDATIRKLAAETALSVESFIYSCLLGSKTACPERRFKPGFLCSETASRHARFYQKHAATRFGTTDTEAILNFSAASIPSIREALQHSEQLFGGWIVGERCKRGGNGVNALYRNRERALSPHWLAIEPTYRQWLSEQTRTSYIERDPETGRKVFNEIERHRQSVTHIPSINIPKLQHIRSEVLPIAVAHVLQKHSVGLEQFLVASPVTNAFRLWLSIGDALLQLKLFSSL